MNNLNSIAVFCGSSNGNDVNIEAHAKELGRILAERNVQLIYGGARVGIMGLIADTVLGRSGTVIGIIPDFLKTKEVVHPNLSELITTQTMHERKLAMHERANAFIALPGGFGTLEELFEIITWAQLGLHKKPIGLLNSNGYFDHLIKMSEIMVEKGFLSKTNQEILLVSDSIEQLLAKMEAYEAPDVPKWLNLNKT
ncbi:LOG family protein [Aegicerativicinus sediminis]|uniref:LOG family protein n=1 Tax=Aegicerativicinus sediminis TaxID=2893202 RepID=UPI001E4D0E97|nr:TIGR00730 family Rossman fold protein [Aegicerativicinus sediminis]